MFWVLSAKWKNWLSEFMEAPLMLFVAVMLIWFRPANEKLAWCLTIVAWFSVVFMYVGHVSTAILGNINL